MLLASLLIAVAAYLLGSIPTGYLLVRLFRHQDIRSVGSGNIGATNVLRSGGKGLGAATFLLDMLKGCSAVWLGALLGHSAHALTPGAQHAQALAALCAVLGHMFPVWLRFRGGKGVATGFGVFLVAAPWAALAAIGRLLPRPAAQPLCLAGLHPRRGQLSRLCLASGPAATARRSSSPSSSPSPCSSSPSTTRTSAACLPARNPASEPKNRKPA
jgi:acyl-phosphate glycerol 3-phosphate acyltransferase